MLYDIFSLFLTNYLNQLVQINPKIKLIINIRSEYF